MTSSIFSRSIALITMTLMCRLSLAVEPIEILNVFIDLDNEQIFVSGKNFDNGGQIEVTLGELGSLPIQMQSHDTVVAGFPEPGLQAGDHLMVLMTGSGENRVTTYPLTIAVTSGLPDTYALSAFLSVPATSNLRVNIACDPGDSVTGFGAAGMQQSDFLLVNAFATELVDSQSRVRNIILFLANNKSTSEQLFEPQALCLDRTPGNPPRPFINNNISCTGSMVELFCNE